MKQYKYIWTVAVLLVLCLMLSACHGIITPVIGEQAVAVAENEATINEESYAGTDEAPAANEDDDSETSPINESEESEGPEVQEGEDNDGPGSDEGEGSDGPGAQEGEGSGGPGAQEGEGSEGPGAQEGEGSEGSGAQEGEGSEGPGAQEGEGSEGSGAQEGEGSEGPGAQEGEGSESSGGGESGEAPEMTGDVVYRFYHEEMKSTSLGGMELFTAEALLYDEMNSDGINGVIHLMSGSSENYMTCVWTDNKDGTLSLQTDEFNIYEAKEVEGVLTIVGVRYSLGMMNSGTVDIPLAQ